MAKEPQKPTPAPTPPKPPAGTGTRPANAPPRNAVPQGGEAVPAATGNAPTAEEINARHETATGKEIFPGRDTPSETDAPRSDGTGGPKPSENPGEQQGRERRTTEDVASIKGKGNQVEIDGLRDRRVFPRQQFVQEVGDGMSFVDLSAVIKDVRGLISAGRSQKWFGQDGVLDYVGKLLGYVTHLSGDGDDEEATPVMLGTAGDGDASKEFDDCCKEFEQFRGECYAILPATSGVVRGGERVARFNPAAWLTIMELVSQVIDVIKRIRDQRKPVNPTP